MTAWPKPFAGCSAFEEDDELTRTLRAATRGSKLALWQTEHVAKLLDADVEIVIVQTEGDRTQAAQTPISAISGRGVFVKEVQNAVLDGRADFAVHSAKDLPSTEPEGLVIAAVPERGDPRDALVGRSLEDLPQGAEIATGSVRRKAQLAHIRPDLRFVNLRGNVDTRIQKAKTHDAVVMAIAPIRRLGLTSAPAFALEPDVMLPQVAQGALAIECRSDDQELIEILQKVEDDASRQCVDAERAFLEGIGSGCDLPVGAYAEVIEDGLSLTALIAAHDGSKVIKRAMTGTDARQLGVELAVMVLDAGGRELLARNG